jgi:hypothetical protein
MDAGKKLDELTAERVLKWKNESGRWSDPEAEKDVVLKPFSTDLNAAWLVVDKICEEGYRLQLEGSRIWQARFYKSVAHTLETRAYDATAGEPSLAICRAALAVRGLETKK